MTIHVKTALILLGTLIIGMVCGGLIVGAVSRGRMQAPPFMPDAFVDRWVGLLNPDAEQKQEIEGIVKRHAPRFRETFNRHRGEMKSLLDSLHQDLTPVLTEEQREILNSRRTRGGRFMDGRRGRGPRRERRAAPSETPPPQ